MITPSSWTDVATILADYPWRTRLRLEKGFLPHPLSSGMSTSSGMPEGQVADYRYAFEDGSGLHVKDFEDHYEAHLDEVHPDVNLIEHLRQDAPSVFIGGSAALGAAVGGLIGKSWKSALAGAAIAGLLGTALAVAAQEDD